jgi:cytidine deaminase
MKPEHRPLLGAARAAMARSYSPYSRFRVGAALLGEDGRIYVGTNVESASYGLSLCAERAAVARAVADGCRAFTAGVVVTETDEPTSPCGACRQVLVEFAPDMVLYLVARDDAMETYVVRDLIPRAFVTFEPGGGA